ncbi:MAG: YbjN domain-containing protein [Pseudomonadota bacterium]
MIDLDQVEAEAAAPPLDMLAHYFEANGWTFERLGEDEIVAKVDGSWTGYQLRALWREDERVLQVIALPDVRVPGEKRLAILETLGLVNEQMWLGHFEMWSSDGTLAFRHGVLLEEGSGGISLIQTETVVEAAIDECERYYPVFQFVLWGEKAPKEALDAALVDTAGEA